MEEVRNPSRRETPLVFHKSVQSPSEIRLHRVSGGWTGSTEEPVLERCEGLCQKQDHRPEKCQQMPIGWFRGAAAADSALGRFDWKWGCSKFTSFWSNPISVSYHAQTGREIAFGGMFYMFTRWVVLSVSNLRSKIKTFKTYRLFCWLVIFLISFFVSNMKNQKKKKNTTAATFKKSQRV